MVFDNEPRNEEIVKKMTAIGKLGYKVCVWPDTIIEKDINDMVLGGINPLDVINKNTLQGLKLQLAIQTWSKI